MQLETEKPSHRTFPSLCYAFESLVDMYPLITAYTQRSTLNKTDAGTFSQQNFLDQQDKRDSNISFQFNKTIIWHDLWEKSAQMFTYLSNPEKDYTILGDVYFFDEQGEYIESVNHVQLQKRIWNNNHSSPPAETVPHKAQ